MAAFLIYDKLRTFWGSTGQLLAGGYIKTYSAGTTTPKDTFGNQSESVNNGSQVSLTSAGRPSVELWGDGNYFIEIYDSANVKQGDVDNVSIYGTGGIQIPALDNGKFLTNNGLVALWQAISQLPDMAGQNAKWLTTNGSAASWSALPAVAIPDIAQTSNSFRIGIEDGSHLLVQWGTGSAPASGAVTTSLAVTYPSAYTTVGYVSITPQPGTQPSAPVLGYLSSPPSNTGFTAVFDAAEGSAPTANITTAVAFGWFAVGLLTDPT